MNDDAARSTTGEIIDQSTVTPQAKTETTPTPTDPATPDPRAADPKPEPPKDGDPSKPKDPATTGAPAEYAAYTLPDGLTLSEDTTKAANELFKGLGLSQEQAQQLVSFHAEQMKVATAASAQDSSYATMRKDWATATLADTEISNYSRDGKRGIDAVKIDIGRALGTLDPKVAGDFKSAMDLTGAGDHPAFVKAFWQLSQKIAEGTHVAGANPSPAGQVKPGTSERPSAAKSLYPNLG